MSMTRCRTSCGIHHPGHDHLADPANPQRHGGGHRQRAVQPVHRSLSAEPSGRVVWPGATLEQFSLQHLRPSRPPLAEHQSSSRGTRLGQLALLPHRRRTSKSSVGRPSLRLPRVGSNGTNALLRAFVHPANRGLPSRPGVRQTHPAPHRDETSAGSDLPKGGALDAEGKLWIAHWQGRTRQPVGSRDGLTSDEIPVPIPGVTGCEFEAAPRAGGIFSCRPGMRGIPGNCSAA